MNLDYPVWNSFQSGILNTPTFVAAGGPAYVSDVFAQPSVAKKQMIADIEVTNPAQLRHRRNSVGSGQRQDRQEREDLRQRSRSRWRRGRTSS
jgi:hypothetical protein